MENIINNKYEIIERVGVGGTSVVYKARRISDDCIVAIKVLRDELSENAQQIERFLRESLALTNLSHENIVNILDVGKTHDGKDYIVMEYVDGLTLKEYIKTKGVLSFDETIEAASQICEGLQHAHDNNIIHRDIKPHNILVQCDGTLKVADFGTARLLDQNTLTMAGKDVVGTVQYISPEQAKGTVLDKRTDIYSLGVVIYEMATGVLPYDGDDAITVAMMHINHSPKRPKDLNPNIPQCLNDIILKCMSKDPAKRYQSAEALRNDLEAAYNDPEHFQVAGWNRTEQRMEGNRMTNRRTSKKQAWRQRRLYIQKLIIMILAVLLVMSGLVFGIVTLINNNTTEQPGPTGNVFVISMVGMQYEQAKEVAIGLGLRLTQEPEYVVSDDVPEGQVISHDPPAEAMVIAHSTIKFVVSSGKARIKVPALINLSEEDAVAKIKDAGLVPKVTLVDTDEYPQLRVYKQSHDTDSKVLENTEIEIFIAKSSHAKKVVPQLIGKTEEEAKQLIEANRFTFGGVVREYNSDFAAGTVFKQDPQNGEFPYDDIVKIKIYISMGSNDLYKGSIDIALPVFEGPTELKIFYYEGLDEIVVYEQTVDESTFAPGETMPFNGDSALTDARIYYVYINNLEYSQVQMLFYDAAGNLVSPTPEPTVPDPNATGTEVSPNATAPVQ